MADWLHDENFLARAKDIRSSQRDRIAACLRENGLESRMAQLVAIRLMSGETALSNEKAESPIEVLFLLALSAPKVETPLLVADTQVQVDRYRVDVAIGEAGFLGDPLFVELDGHDFHERTKEQAERDRRRDRWFAMEGLRIVRFTGREVWRDPEACADEAVDLYFKTRREIELL